MAVFDVTTYRPVSGNKYFVDCNVLMYEFYSNGAYASNLVSKYDVFFTKAIEEHATIYVTEMLVSEFVNTYVQPEFHRLAHLHGWPHTKDYFKHIFKTTSEYADILKEIEIILNKQLFPITEKKNVSFEDTKLMGIFDNPATFDFNDRYYARSFPGEDVYFVTNDADFNNITGINIITANQKMLDGVCE